jgi:type VI secretion system secreted protein Hcp
MALFDAFLFIEGIPGESVDSKHPNELDIESFSWGESSLNRGAATGGAGAGKVSMQDFHFVARSSVASPRLMTACASGKHFPSATLTCRKAGGTQVDFIRLKLYDVMVSEYKLAGDRGSLEVESLPTDQFSLAFVKIDFNFLSQDPRTGGLVSDSVIR